MVKFVFSPHAPKLNDILFGNAITRDHVIISVLFMSRNQKKCSLMNTKFNILSSKINLYWL